jgi:hypothetical protein
MSTKVSEAQKKLCQLAEKQAQKRTPKKVVETPKEVVETPKKVVETPKKVVETPKKVVETPKKVVETPKEVEAVPKVVRTVVDLSSLYDESTSPEARACINFLKKGRKQRGYTPFTSRNMFIHSFQLQALKQVKCGPEEFEDLFTGKWTSDASFKRLTQTQIYWRDCVIINRNIPQADGPLGSSENAEVIEVGNVDDFYYVMYSDGGDSDVPLTRLLYLNEHGKVDEYVCHTGNQIIPYGRGYTAWSYEEMSKEEKMEIEKEKQPEHKNMDGYELAGIFIDDYFDYDFDNEIKLIFKN